MSDHADTNPRKRKLSANRDPGQEDSGAVEEPDPAPAHDNPGPSTHSERIILRPTAACAAEVKHRRQYEKFVSSVITASNFQHDLQTQRALAALQAQSSDSDDEPSVRRLRPSGVPTATTTTQAVISSPLDTRDIPTTSSNIDRQDLIKALEATRISDDVSLSLNPPGDNSVGNNSDRHQQKCKRSDTATCNSYNELTEARDISTTNAVPLGAVKTDFNIPIPNTSTNSVNSSLNIMTYDQYFRFENDSRMEEDGNESIEPTPEESAPPEPDNSTGSTNNAGSRNRMLHAHDNRLNIESENSSDELSINVDDLRLSRRRQYGAPHHVERMMSHDSSDEDECIQHIIFSRTSQPFNTGLDSPTYQPYYYPRHENGPVVPPRLQPQPSSTGNRLGNDLPPNRPIPPAGFTISPFGSSFSHIYPLHANAFYFLKDDGLFYSVQATGLMTNTPPRPDRQDGINHNHIPPIRWNSNWEPINRRTTAGVPSAQVRFDPELGSSSDEEASRTLHSQSSNSTEDEESFQAAPSPPAVLPEPVGSTEAAPMNREAASLQEAGSSRAVVPIEDNRGAPDGAESRNNTSTPMDTPCPICKKDIKKKKLVSTLCGHILCVRCILKKIIKNGTQCPICRKALGVPLYYPLN